MDYDKIALLYCTMFTRIIIIKRRQKLDVIVLKWIFNRMPLRGAAYFCVGELKNTKAFVGSRVESP